MVREWRHVRLMKRFGRGHDSSGVAGTSKGNVPFSVPLVPTLGRIYHPIGSDTGNLKSTYEKSKLLFR